MNTVTETLKRLVKEDPRSASKLARAAGWPSSGLSQFMTGKTASPKYDAIESLAAALETSVVEILGGDNKFQTIPIDRLHLSISNPRGSIDMEKLGELMTSIAEKGIVVPLIVRPSDEGKFQIVAGERRFRAA